jgi:hypothetical protein
MILQKLRVLSQIFKIVSSVSKNNGSPVFNRNNLSHELREFARIFLNSFAKIREIRGKDSVSLSLIPLETGAKITKKTGSSPVFFHSYPNFPIVFSTSSKISPDCTSAFMAL